MSFVDEVHFRLRIEEIQTGRQIFQKYSLKQILNGAGNNSLYFNVVSADRFTEKYDSQNAPIYAGDIVKSLQTGFLFKIVYEYGKHVGTPIKSSMNINIPDISTTEMKCYTVVGNVYESDNLQHRQ